MCLQPNPEIADVYCQASDSVCCCTTDLESCAVHCHRFLSSYCESILRSNRYTPECSHTRRRYGTNPSFGLNFLTNAQILMLNILGRLGDPDFYHQPIGRVKTLADLQPLAHTAVAACRPNGWCHRDSRRYQQRRSARTVPHHQPRLVPALLPFLSVSLHRAITADSMQQTASSMQHAAVSIRQPAGTVQRSASSSPYIPARARFLPSA